MGAQHSASRDSPRTSLFALLGNSLSVRRVQSNAGTRLSPAGRHVCYVPIRRVTLDDKAKMILAVHVNRLGANVVGRTQRE
jgi:hypothetical protein